MKKIHILIALLFISITAIAGGNEKFQQKMGETLGGYATAQSPEDFQQLANKFARIASVEKKEWLPLYYQAHCLIIKSFVIKGEPAQRDEILDQVEKNVEAMLELAPEESEVFALQAFYYTARLTVDPQSRGMEYSMLSNQAIGKSLGINPQNLRARYMKISNDMGAARFFGKNPADYCPDAKALYDSWDEVKSPSPIHPQWGKDQVAELLNSCK